MRCYSCWQNIKTLSLQTSPVYVVFILFIVQTLLINAKLVIQHVAHLGFKKLIMKSECFLLCGTVAERCDYSAVGTLTEWMDNSCRCYCMGVELVLLDWYNKWKFFISAPHFMWNFISNIHALIQTDTFHNLHCGNISSFSVYVHTGLI